MSLSFQRYFVLAQAFEGVRDEEESGPTEFECKSRPWPRGWGARGFKQASQALRPELTVLGTRSRHAAFLQYVSDISDYGIADLRALLVVRLPGQWKHRSLSEDF